MVQVVVTVVMVLVVIVVMELVVIVVMELVVVVVMELVVVVTQEEGEEEWEEHPREIVSNVENLGICRVNVPKQVCVNI